MRLKFSKLRTKLLVMFLLSIVAVMGIVLVISSNITYKYLTSNLGSSLTARLGSFGTLPPSPSFREHNKRVRNERNGTEVQRANR